jgi:hypothetical protein
MYYPSWMCCWLKRTCAFPQIHVETQIVQVHFLLVIQVLFSGYFVSSAKSCRDTNCASAFSSVYTSTFSGSFVSSVRQLSKTGTDPLGHQSGPWGSEPQFSRKEPILIY